ncbi:glycoside hydrolase family 3 C-terminal domain-containing protein [Gracilibacillus sp. D59]|uniref:glycoside hydrolase family 3 C-terminal domain-containing protein n=1 Tax=Gracilibacillus sp. D59 TaxID=3457434 RepID=UPI003FCCBF90
MSKKVISMMALVVLLLSSFSVSNVTAEETVAPQLRQDNIDEVIAAMTLEEKAKLVTGIGWAAFNDELGAAGKTHEIPRLGIPSIALADGPAGVRINPTRENTEDTFYATAFPIATAVASSWDTDVAEKVGAAMGNELKEYGVDVLLAPALNLHRNPLNGRNFEYYSEDPLVSGKMTAAVVNGVESNGVGATIKHFVANNQETNRQTIDTIVSQQALREIYLKGFEIAVKESQPWAVMSAYNKLNGVYTPQNSELLTDVLREDWGFEGVVMTDWGGGDDPVAAMEAQNDLLMPGSEQQSNAIIAAVESGELDENLLDRNVKNILNIIVQTPSFLGYEHSDNPDLEAHAQVSREAATEGMVLLENHDQALPLKDNISIGLFGNGKVDTIKGGTGSGDVNVEHTVTIVEGFQAAGYSLDEELVENYQTYVDELKALPEYQPPSPFQPAPPLPEREVTEEEAKSYAESTDVGMIVISRNSGEFADRNAAEGDFYLTETEQANIDKISNAFHNEGKQVVTVLNIGGPIEMVSWKDKVDAILLAWQPGSEAGHAVADVLSGKVNPSGKLATTFPKDYPDTPSVDNFPGYPEEDPTEVVYEEDIYVGYRYHHTFGVEPAYEFGYGLSYTEFDYDKIRVNKNGKFNDKITVFASITNSGDVAGKEAVQVYVAAPDGSIENPDIELAAFTKTDTIQPRKKENIKIDITASDIASFDESKSAWVVEKGTYELSVASSSENVEGTASFTVSEDIIVDEVNDVLAPERDIDRLTK